MQFRLLGPVEIEVDGNPVSLLRRRDRCLLAVLLLEANRAVSVGQLADLLWDGDPPDRARRSIHGQVSRVRATLAASGSGGAVLATVGAGYRIEVDPELVDVHRFRALLDDAARTGDLVDRVDRIRAALELWRGPLMANAASDTLRDRLEADLAEQRLAAMEELFSGSLALRREREILPGLAKAAAAHPGRESLVMLHMQALYQADRKIDALEVYQSARAYLAGELGLDPGPRLCELHQRILRDQWDAPPSPAEPTALTVAAPTGTMAVVVPRQLPADVAGFAGRAASLARLDALLPGGDNVATSVKIAAVSGTAGVGKTALVVHWAHRVADRFPDGQLYVNLRGFGPDDLPAAPATAVRGFLDALQVRPESVPANLDAQVGLYRSLLADRRMLVILDNSRDADQVRPLLPGAPGCVVVVTSRNQLSSLVTVEGAQPVMLDLLALDEARELLAARLGDKRTAAEPDAVDEIIMRCAQLPLALAVVATRAATHPSFSLGGLAKELREAGSSLDVMSDPDTSTDLQVVFSWSYHALSPAAARLFRLLGLHPGPDLSVPAAASLAGDPVPAARRRLAELAHAHLVIEPSPGRFTFHDLLRVYATALAHEVEAEANRQAAVHRMLDYYATTAHCAARRLNPHRKPTSLDPVQPGVTPMELSTHDDAFAWLIAEHPVLLAAVPQAVGIGCDVHAWQLAWATAEFLDRRGQWHDLLAVQWVALGAARRLDDREMEAGAHRSLGIAYRRLGSHLDAQTHMQDALLRFEILGDMRSQAATQVGLSMNSEQRGRYQEALHHAERAVDLSRATSHRVGEALSLNCAGRQYILLGDYQQGISYCRQALAILQEVGEQLGLSEIWGNLGFAHHHLGQHSQAIACYERAVELFRAAGKHHQMAVSLCSLGDNQYTAGRHDSARDTWRQALSILDEVGHPDAADVRAKLGAGQGAG